MRNSKKIISVVLAVLMAVSMMPLSVFAASSTQTETSVASITVTDPGTSESVTTYYDTLEEAFAATPDNAETATTIKVLQDVATTSTIYINNGKNVKLNINSKTVTSANVDPMFRIEGGRFETSGKGTIQSTTNDCTIFRVVGKKDAPAQYSYLLVGGSNTGNGNCTTVISKEYGVLIPSTSNYADGVYVEVKGIIQSGVSAIYTNGNINKYGENPAQVVLRSSSSPKLICTDDKNNAVHDNVAVYAAGYAEWTFNTGSVTGPTALYAKCGKFELKGTSFKGNGDAVAYSHNSNGITATGEAVVFENCSGYLNELDVNITKGTFNSVNADPIGTYAYSKGTDNREEIDEFVSGGAFQVNGVGTDVSEYYTDELAEKFATGNAYIESNIFSLDVDGRINTSAPGAKIVRDGKDYYCGNVIKAANNSVAGDTVVALTDYSTGSQVVISVPDVTIDLNGYTFNSTSSLYPIRIQDGASATFTNGTITNPNGISMVGDSSLVIAEDCVVNGNISNYDTSTTTSSTATVDIYGTVNGTIKPNTAGTEVNIYDGAEINATTAINPTKGTVTVYGGDINGNVTKGSAATVVVPATSTAVFDSDVSTYVPDGYNVEYDETAGGYVVNVDPTFNFAVNETTGVEYATLKAAIAAAADGDAIKLMGDEIGEGIQIAADKYPNGITVDFNGNTYYCESGYVGSTGTQRQVFQLQKGNTITFKDGAIESSSARMLIQNYSDLTLDNMTLNQTGHTSFADKVPYALSNNNGNVTIKDTTINACEDGVAFDACRYSTYPSVNVTVTGTSVINGDVEMSASANDAKDGLAINLVGGTLNGDVVLDSSAVAAIDATPNKASVTKASTFTQDAPEGYVWSGDGATQTLVRENYEDPGCSFTLANGEIVNNVYLDGDYPADYTVVFTYNHNSDIAEEKDVRADAPVAVGTLTKTADGYKFPIKQAPAQFCDEISYTVYDPAGVAINSDTFTSKEVCEAGITTYASDTELVALFEAMLDYAKAAQDYFDYDAGSIAAYNDDDVQALDSIPSTGASSQVALTGISMVVTSDLGVNLYTDGAVTVTSVSGVAGVTAVAGKNEGKDVIRVRGIAPADLGKNITIVTDQGTIVISAYTAARSIVADPNASAALKDLARAVYLYGEAAADYFA